MHIRRLDLQRGRHPGRLDPLTVASLALLLLASCRGVASDVEIPEPLVFDLVRGLGAERGELETNVLAAIPLRSGDPAAPEVAPEVEYAVADGVALELELPFEDDGLYSIKTAAQMTLSANEAAGFLQGVQVIVERLVDEDAWDFALLYVPGLRIDEEYSVLAMLGVGGFAGPDVEDELGVLANVTLFHRLDDAWTVGLEVDSETFGDFGHSVLVMPQAQWEGSDLDSFTLQFGVGGLYVDGTVAAGSEILIPDTEGWFPQIVVRAIVEF